jgi:hypothetical protein
MDGQLVPVDRFVSVMTTTAILVKEKLASYYDSLSRLFNKLFTAQPARKDIERLGSPCR